MRPSLLSLMVAVSVLAGSARVAAAQQSATQVVTFAVNPVNALAVTGNPAPLVVNTATAGSDPTAATVGGTSYAITTNQRNEKIVASLDRAMPPDVTLAIALGAPAGASSAGAVVLTTAGVDAVGGLSPVSAAGLPITYTLTATPAAGTVPQDTRTVTLTIVAGP